MEDCRCFQSIFGTVKDGLSTRKHFFDVVIRQTRRTPYPWLVACAANMEPEALSQGSWHNERYMTIKTPRGGSTCRSTSQDGVLVTGIYHCVTVRRGLENKVTDMEVVEESDSRPHKPVVFRVMLGKS